MENALGAVSHIPPVAPACQTQAEKPAPNMTKVIPQDTFNISAAGKAAGQVKPAAKPAEDAKHGSQNAQAILPAIRSKRSRFGAPLRQARRSGRSCVFRGAISGPDLTQNFAEVARGNPSFDRANIRRERAICVHHFGFRAHHRLRPRGLRTGRERREQINPLASGQ